MKFVVNEDAKLPIARFLCDLGIKRSHLFPDLQNTAEEIASRYPHE